MLRPSLIGLHPAGGVPVSITISFERRDIMKFTRDSIAGKACVAGLTFATALSMVPAAAFGANLDANTANITINGLSEGDQITAYQILDRDYDHNTNNVTDRFISVTDPTLKDFPTLEDFQGLTSDGDTYVNGSAMQQAADKIASAIKAGAATALAERSATADDQGTAAIADAPAGEWLILVTAKDGSVKKVYQNTIVSNAPEVDDATGKYEAKDAEATIKSTEETVNKGVGTTAADAKSNKTADGTYGIGDFVPFVISTTIPNYPANSTNHKFVIGDAPSAGLAIQEDSIKVSVGGTEVPATDPDTQKANYTVTVSDAGVMTIEFTDDYIMKHTGESVLVNYQSKVTSAAQVTNSDTTHNSATITFNPNPYEKKESTPGDTNEVKTYGLFFMKKGDGKALEGATFKIKYAEAVNGHKVGDYVKDEDGNDFESISGADGYIFFEDLAKGKYTLEEVSVPSGFQKVGDISVNLTGDTKNNPGTKNVVEANYQELDDVEDPKVGMLPTTGDAGTIGLTAAGICLVAGSAFVIAGRVRRSKDDQE